LTRFFNKGKRRPVNVGEIIKRDAGARIALLSLGKSFQKNRPNDSILKTRKEASPRKEHAVIVCTSKVGALQGIRRTLGGLDQWEYILNLKTEGFKLRIPLSEFAEKKF